jgi:hypothetical protein
MPITLSHTTRLHDIRRICVAPQSHIRAPRAIERAKPRIGTVGSRSASAPVVDPEPSEETAKRGFVECCHRSNRRPSRLRSHPLDLVRLPSSTPRACTTSSGPALPRSLRPASARPEADLPQPRSLSPSEARKRRNAEWPRNRHCSDPAIPELLRLSHRPKHPQPTSHSQALAVRRLSLYTGAISEPELEYEEAAVPGCCAQ